MELLYSRSTYCSVWSTPEKALEHVKSFFEEMRDSEEDSDDEETAWDLDTYQTNIPDDYYCSIEEQIVDGADVADE